MAKSTSVRTDFVQRWGTEALRVVTLVQQGKSTSEISRRTGISTLSIAAYKANLSRNSYRPFASVRANGSVVGKLFG